MNHQVYYISAFSMIKNPQNRCASRWSSAKRRRWWRLRALGKQFFSVIEVALVSLSMNFFKNFLFLCQSVALRQFIISPLPGGGFSLLQGGGGYWYIANTGSYWLPFRLYGERWSASSWFFQCFWWDLCYCLPAPGEYISLFFLFF